MKRWTVRPPKHRRIAPRLASGDHRIPSGNGLPPAVKYAIQSIANAEGRSFSWVVEEILIDWARNDARLRSRLKADDVAYQPRKADAAQQEREHAEDARLKAAAHARKAS
jgi:hypothetical protein